MTITFGSRSQFAQCETGCVVGPSDSLRESFFLYLILARNRSKRKAPQPKLVPQETLDYLNFRPILSTKLLDRCFCPFYLVLDAGTARCCSDGVVLRRSR